MELNHLNNDRRTLASSVYDQIRQDILSGHLPPGEKLRSGFLKIKYKSGNTPLREALNRLSSDGLVVQKDQRGFYVTPVSKPELLELVKTRCWLEGLALKESIRNREPEWEERLVLAHHRLSRAPRSLEKDTYVISPEWESLHREFHRALISACGSRILLDYCNQMADQADRYRQLATGVSYPDRNEMGEHKAITEAAIEGDEKKAIQLLEDHFNLTSKIIFSSLPY